MTQTIQEFATSLIDRLKTDFDNFIVVDSGGEKGTGKSTFSILLAKEICRQINYPYSFDLIAFNPTTDKVRDMITKLPDYVPIHVDECIRISFKRDFAKEYQKDLIKFITLCRKFRKIIIFNIPDFNDLDKALKNLAIYRVLIVKRGLAQLLKKSENPDALDKWQQDDNFKMIERVREHSIGGFFDIQRGIRTTSSWLYDIPFGELDKKTYSDYFELSKVEETKDESEDIKASHVKLLAMANLFVKSADTYIDASQEANTEIANTTFGNNPEKYTITENQIQKWVDKWESFKLKRN